MSLLLLFRGAYTPPSGDTGKTAALVLSAIGGRGSGVALSGWIGMDSIDPQEGFDLAVDAFLTLLNVDGIHDLAVIAGSGWSGKSASRGV